jgi:hypothetical protein
LTDFGGGDFTRCGSSENQRVLNRADKLEAFGGERRFETRPSARKRASASRESAKISVLHSGRAHHAREVDQERVRSVQSRGNIR